VVRVRAQYFRIGKTTDILPMRRATIKGTGWAPEVTVGGVGPWQYLPLRLLFGQPRFLAASPDRCASVCPRRSSLLSYCWLQRTSASSHCGTRQASLGDRYGAMASGV
jgi:hypothetical protein